MNHRSGKKHFNRTSAHRLAFQRNLAVAIIKHGQVKTTLAKAKWIRSFLEPLITKSATQTLHVRRYLIQKLRDKDAVNKLLSDLGPRYQKRPGGYVRVIKSGFRTGDAAPMAYITFVE